MEQKVRDEACYDVTRKPTHSRRDVLTVHKDVFPDFGDTKIGLEDRQVAVEAVLRLNTGPHS